MDSKSVHSGGPERFSESVLWQLQQDYFVQKGIDAWRLREVPNYIVSNPVFAGRYAEMVWAFLQDKVSLEGTLPAPITICELGAGSGEFAFHFIRRMIRLCENGQQDITAAFRYVLTDIADSTLSFLKSHPRFRSWIDKGILDVARFDVLQDTQLALQVSGETIGPGDLENPLVLIANYLFDSIPQDLIRLKNGSAEMGSVSVSFSHESDAAAQLKNCSITYSYQPVIEPIYSEPLSERLFQEYKTVLKDSYLLFPGKGWQVLQKLEQLSVKGLLLLSADKGITRMDQLEGHPLPEIQCHGSISMPVNIHALARLTEISGGVSLLPEKENFDFNVFALVLGDQAGKHTAFESAYNTVTGFADPYDYYLNSKHLRSIANSLSLKEMISTAIQSEYDVHLFVYFLPNLLSGSDQFSDVEKKNLALLIDKVWNAYYPLGEKLDLGYQLGCLLYSILEYEAALRYFQYSVGIYGAFTGIYYNMALCHELLGQKEQAIELLQKIMASDPSNKIAFEKLRQFGVSR